ncbi:MAG: VOC family protein [Alphaproteobacteria bacterium]|nr:VOC family protein [Alphaproteobacteria bacterium]
MTLVRISRAAAILVVSANLLPSAAQAAPVADDQRMDLDLRRTTLVVHDMDASLAFYRDALGMVVTYDNMLRNPQDAKTNEEAESATHLVFLRANDDFIGILGLMASEKPARSAYDAMPDPFRPGSIVLLFNTDGLAEKFERAKNSPKIKVVRPPTNRTFPSYDGKSRIPVLSSILIDPDGHVVELNDLLMDPEDM